MDNSDWNSIFASRDVNICWSSWKDRFMEVYSNNTVTVVNSSFSGCRAYSGDGGAIYSGSAMSIVNSTTNECLALNGNGGAIFSAARLSQLVLSRSTFNNNGS